MTSPLEALAGPAKPLQAEPPDAAEIEDLLRSGRARLHDARLVEDLVVACEAVVAALPPG